MWSFPFSIKRYFIQHPSSNTSLALAMAITAQCHKLLEAEILQRSSQIVSVVNNQAYIFGGELRPREPRDNLVYAVSLDNGKLRAIKGRLRVQRC